MPVTVHRLLHTSWEVSDGTDMDGLSVDAKKNRVSTCTDVLLRDVVQHGHLYVMRVRCDQHDQCVERNLIFF